MQKIPAKKFCSIDPVHCVLREREREKEWEREGDSCTDLKGCSSSRVDAVRCTDNKDWDFLSWLTVAFFKYFSQSGQIDEREGPNCATHDDRDDDHFWLGNLHCKFNVPKFKPQSLGWNILNRVLKLMLVIFLLVKYFDKSMTTY